MELNKTKRYLRIKIAYYGPAVGGKTTNLNVLYQHALTPRRGDFVSINSQQDRTILCDLLPMKAGGFCGFDVRLQLLAVPGQSVYMVSRRAVLKGSDGVVFVANSATDRWHENVQAFSELNAHLRAQGLDPAIVPMVFQYNKRDLPEVLEVEALDRALNQRGAPSFLAVARTGEGVLETLSAILELTLDYLTKRHGALVLPDQQSVAVWTKRTIRSLFGRDSLQGIALEEEKPGVDRPFKLQIPMPEEQGRSSSGPADVRSAESLAESYAQASAELGVAMHDLRLERDKAQSRLTEVRTALHFAEGGPGAPDIEARALRVLEILARAVDASNASFFLTLGPVPEVLLLPPLVADPLSRSASTTFLDGQRGTAEAQLYLAGEDADLTDALAKADPPFKAVVVVPLRSAERLLGLALLYFWPHATLPDEDSLRHLTLLARVLAGPLEATAAREAASDARRMRALSRASAGAMVSVLTRLPANALRRQRLAIEDLLAPLEAPGVSIEVDAGTQGVNGDAALLRFALTTLIHRCEAAALDRDERPEIRVRATGDSFVVQIHVMSGRPGAGASGQDKPHADSDAEMSAVHAVLAQHGGYFLVPEGEVSATHFTVQFDAA
jgi:signal recognition particle receptor subunit beta/GAF domain-containing protein